MKVGRQVGQRFDVRSMRLAMEQNRDMTVCAMYVYYANWLRAVFNIHNNFTLFPAGPAGPAEAKNKKKKKHKTPQTPPEPSFYPKW